MVASDKYLRAVKLLHNLPHTFFLMDAEVSKVVDQVVGLNLLVPVKDKKPVHFLYRGKGPLFVLDNALMSEVSVPDKIYHR